MGISRSRPTRLRDEVDAAELHGHAALGLARVAQVLDADAGAARLEQRRPLIAAHRRRLRNAAARFSARNPRPLAADAGGARGSRPERRLGSREWPGRGRPTGRCARLDVSETRGRLRCEAAARRQPICGREPLVEVCTLATARRTCMHRSCTAYVRGVFVLRAAQPEAPESRSRRARCCHGSRCSSHRPPRC